MSGVSWTAEKIETNRQEAIAEYLSNGFEEQIPTPEEMAKNNQPGTYACHEALDTASELVFSTDRRLLEHPSIMSNPEWFTLAYNAHTAIFNLYQAIGEVHLDLTPDNIIDLIEAKKATLANTK